jgi:hypothetical protein
VTSSFQTNKQQQQQQHITKTNKQQQNSDQYIQPGPSKKHTHQPTKKKSDNGKKKVLNQ